MSHSIFEVLWGAGDEEEHARDVDDIKYLNDVPRSLFWWNLAATIVQLGQAAALFYLSSQATTQWFLFTNFPNVFVDDIVESSGGGGAFGTPFPKQIAAFSVTWYSGVFMLLSGLNHLATIAPGLRFVYEDFIERSQNPFRWIEYSFSASLMRVMIAQLSGVTDVHVLFTVFVLSATTMVLGWCHESVNAKARNDDYRQNWFPFFAAWLPHLASWSVIFCYFFVSASRGNPPAFVWAIVFVLFVLDGIFALLFWLQWGKIGAFDDYTNGEIGFIVLSFTSKSLLAWINFFGGSR